MEHHMFDAPVPCQQGYSTFDDWSSATDLWNDFITLGLKNDSGNNRSEYVRASKVLEDLLPLLMESSATAKQQQKFSLRHPDLSINNIFIDQDFNITCLIDWAFATSAPVAFILTPPGLPHPRNDIDASLTAAFEAGVNGGFEIASGLPRISSSVFKRSRMVWLFTRLVNLNSLQDLKIMTDLLALVYGQDQIDVKTCFERVARQKGLAELFQRLTAEDRSFEEIARAETQYFEQVGIQTLALSQKLSLVADFGNQFIADVRLWKWINQ